MVPVNELLALIEPHFHHEMTNDHYQVDEMDPLDLLTSNRLDLAFKLFYLEMKERNLDLATSVYYEHIRAFSLGSLSEPGNGSKRGLDIFLQEFDKLSDGIKTSGFEQKKSLIPLAYNRTIANGAHRTACAIFNKKKIFSINIMTEEHLYDYKFFFNRKVPVSYIELAVDTFIKYSNNTFIAFIWPSAVGHDSEIDEIIPNIVYQKNIQLTDVGAHNLVTQIYHDESWLGSAETNYKGAYYKLVECFKNKANNLRIYIFSAQHIDEVKEIKDKIRNVFAIGKHSIHITDTKEEAINISRFILNENGIHFLNYARPFRYKSTCDKVCNLLHTLQEHKINPDDIVLDSGMVLAAYGIRETRDVDCYISDNQSFSIASIISIDNHDDQLMHHGKSKRDLLYNPHYFFYFSGIKFVSFNQVYSMKKRRNEVKDGLDCKMMEGLIQRNCFKVFVNSLRQNFLYQKIKLTHSLIIVSRQVRIYPFLKTIDSYITKKK